MIITVSINGVLRDILGKFEQIYEKYQGKEVKSPVITPDLMDYVDFKDDDELIEFLYNDATMEIFGQAKEIDNNVISHLVELYKEMPLDYKLKIVSDDMGKSKSATLWFLSKYGLVCDEIVFYTNSTISELWKNSDIFITADTEVIKNKPVDKKLIIIDKCYNQGLECDLRVNTLKEIKSLKNVFEENVITQ
jgi:hypothetical protein|tara:strand:+ start:247 stop:822 length:576 start_codon:yes stop_codon:yes gene_type:complete